MINQFNENIHDGIIFLDNIELFSYKSKSKPEISEIGTKYHIILKENTIVHFEAIISPVHYVNNMIKINQQGIVAKKTKNSKKVIKHFINMLSES